MTTVAARRATAPLTNTIQVPVTAVGAFLPMKLTKARDGGSVFVDGQLNKSVSARIRLDGGVNSPTRGQFFITTRHFLKGAQPERAMTPVELRDLGLAITRHMAQTPGRQPEYADFNSRIRKAYAATLPTPKVNVAKIPTSVIGPNANASVNGDMFVNRMPGPGPRTNEVIASVKIQGNGFNDAPPKYSVQKIEVYEKGSNKLVAAFNKPKGSAAERVGRGIFGLDFSLKFDASKVDFAKQYAFVFTTGINGSAPKQVRSEFMNITQAF